MVVVPYEVEEEREKQMSLFKYHTRQKKLLQAKVIRLLWSNRSCTVLYDTLYFEAQIKARYTKD